MPESAGPARGRVAVFKRPLRLFQFVALPLFALPVTLLAQAAVEYGMRSAGGAVSGDSGFATIAGCKVDSALLTCLNHSYPGTMLFIAVVIGLIMLRWLSGRARYRAR
jgi:hypothetical protein